MSSLAPPSKILKTVKKNASQGAILRLPENPSFKRALNKAKNKENPVPPAPTTLDDIVLDPTEIKSFRGEPMLLHDNSNHRRLIMFGTQKNRRILHAVERYDPDTMDIVVYLDSLRNVM